MTSRRKQGEVYGGESCRNSELLLKRLGQDFIFLCQIFLDFPLRRKLTGVSSELRLLSCTPLSFFPLFAPYNLFFHFIVSPFSSFTTASPCSYFLRNYFLMHFHAISAVSVSNFVYFISGNLLLLLLSYLPFLSFSPCYSSQHPIHRFAGFY